MMMMMMGERGQMRGTDTEMIKNRAEEDKTI
jgi:hypothetical protein